MDKCSSELWGSRSLYFVKYFLNLDFWDVVKLFVFISMLCKYFAFWRGTFKCILPCDMFWVLYRLDLCPPRMWILPFLGVVILYALLNLFSIPCSFSSEWVSVLLKVRKYLQDSSEILLGSRLSILWMFSGPLRDFMLSLHLPYLGTCEDIIWLHPVRRFPWSDYFLLLWFWACWFLCEELTFPSFFHECILLISIISILGTTSSKRTPLS